MGDVRTALEQGSAFGPSPLRALYSDGEQLNC